MTTARCAPPTRDGSGGPEQNRAGRTGAAAVAPAAEADDVSSGELNLGDMRGRLIHGLVVVLSTTLATQTWQQPWRTAAVVAAAAAAASETVPDLGEDRRSLQESGVVFVAPALLSFSCPQAGALPGANMELEGGYSYAQVDTVGECATACLNTAGCVSFDYDTSRGRCYFGDDVLDSNGALVPSAGYSYYELATDQSGGSGCRYGCTGAEAANYDPAAEEDDGSCIETVEGCGDRTALNFNASVTLNNSRLCAYSSLSVGFACPELGFWVPAAADAADPDGGTNLTGCAVLCSADTACLGFVYRTARDGSACLPLSADPTNASSGDRPLDFYRRRGAAQALTPTCAFGCHDERATNFDAAADADDESCTFIRGCTDPESPFFEPAAVLDDGSCNRTAMSLFSCPGRFEATDSPVAVHADVSREECAGLCIRNSSCLSFDFNIANSTSVSARCFLRDVDESNATLQSNRDFARHILVGVQDGGCVYGCTDEDAFNFDPSAESDDGSCRMPSFGCTDPEALNFWPAATTDNGNCVFTDLALHFDCPIPGVLMGHNIEIPELGRSYFSDVLTPGACASICVNFTGCVSFEYSKPLSRCYLGNGQRGDASIVDAGSFSYYERTNRSLGCMYGCTESTASNYNAGAESDDGSCLLPCTESTCAGHAIQRYTCSVSGRLPEGNLIEMEGGATQILNVNSAETCAEMCISVPQCRSFDYSTIESLCHLGDAQVGENTTFDGTYEYFEAVRSNLDGCLYGCTEPQAFNFDNRAQRDDGGCVAVQPGCMDNTAENFDSEANTDDGSCTYPSSAGCTDPDATNFDSEATEDDGSCIIALRFGCTNPMALNYDGTATIADGSCIFVSAALDVFSCPSVGVLTGMLAEHSQNVSDIARGTDACAVRCRATDTCESFHASNTSCFINQRTDGVQGAELNPDEADFTYYERVGLAASCIYGCRDVDAYNYDDAAQYPDDSCVPRRYGCTDPLSSSFNATANTDDDSCVVDAAISSFACPIDGSLPGRNIVLEGSMTHAPSETISLCASFCVSHPDCRSFNFSPITRRCYLNTALVSAELALEPSSPAVGYQYFERVSRAVDACGWGCNNASALNHDPDTGYHLEELCVARLDGCTDARADNHDPAATVDDGSCQIDYLRMYRCPRAGAFTASDAAQVPVSGSAVIEDCAENCTESIGCIGFLALVTDASCYILLDRATEDPEGLSSRYYETRSASDPECRYGCTNVTFDNYDDAAEVDDGSCASALAANSSSEGSNTEGDGDTNAGAEEPEGEAVRQGCMSASAINYDPLAQVDDGSCIARRFGCTDTAAVNWNSLANQDDGSCVSILFGCMDNSALNFDSAATVDDGGCVLVALSAFECPAEGRLDGDDLFQTTNITAEECAQLCLGSEIRCVSFDYRRSTSDCFLGNGIVGFDGPLLNDTDYEYYHRHSPGCRYGCTNATASNFDPAAVRDDGSCLGGRAGCMEPGALNYDRSANVRTSCAFSNASLVFECPRRGALQSSTVENIAVVPAMAAEDCAAACLAEGARCGSFDFSAVVQRCHLFVRSGQLWSGPPGYAYHHYVRAEPDEEGEAGRLSIGCSDSSAELRSVLDGFTAPLPSASLSTGFGIVAEHTKVESAAQCAMFCVGAGSSPPACKAFAFASAIHYCYLLSMNMHEAAALDPDANSTRAVPGYELYERRVLRPAADWAVQPGLVALPSLVAPFGAMVEFVAGPLDPVFSRLADGRMVYLMPSASGTSGSGGGGGACGLGGVLVPASADAPGRTLYGLARPGVHHFVAADQLCHLGQRLAVNATFGE
eukprot:SAG22_NODE_140_length_17982_cov_81.438741_5_plen_1804_part_00